MSTEITETAQETPTFVLEASKWSERAEKARKTAGLTKLLKEDAIGWIITSVRTICSKVDLEDAEMRRCIANVLLGIQMGRIEQASMHGTWDAAGIAELGPQDGEWPSKHRAILECFGLNPDITIEGENAWGCMVVDEKAVKALAKARAKADKARSTHFMQSRGQWFAFAAQTLGMDMPDIEDARKLVGTQMEYHVEGGWVVKTPDGTEYREPNVQDIMGPVLRAEAFGMVQINPQCTRVQETALTAVEETEEG